MYWELLVRLSSTDGNLVRGNSCHKFIVVDLLITSFFSMSGTVKSCINSGSWSPGRYSSCSHHTRRNTDAVFSRIARLFVFCMCTIEIKTFILVQI